MLTMAFPEQQTSKTKVVFDKSFWLAILFLLPAFTHRLSAGGEAASFDDLNTLSLTAVGYICNALLIVFIQFSVKVKPLNSTFYMVFLVIAVIGALQTFLVFESYVLLGSGIILIYIRAMIWLYAIILYSRSAFEPRAFLNAFVWLARIGLAITALCGLSHLLIGTNFGIIIAQGASRAHGIFSEPSALSGIAPAFMIISLFRRNYTDIIIVTLAVLFSSSTLVFISTAVMGLIFIAHRSSRFQKIIITTYIAVFVLSVAFINKEVAYIVSDFGQYINRALDDTIGRSEFRSFVIDRLIIAMIDLPNYFNVNFANFSDTGNLARFAGPQVMMTLMQSDGFYAFGYGLSNFGAVAILVFKSVLDFGLLPFLISSFGVYLGVSATIWGTYRIIAWRKMDVPIFFIFTGALIGTIGNSAGGLTIYALVFLGALAWQPALEKSKVT
jgi:hypothetical protein